MLNRSKDQEQGAMKRTILLLVCLVVLVGEILPRTALATDPQIMHTDHLPPLLRAAEAGRTEEVRRLLERGANVNEKFPELHGLTPLMLAAMRGHLDTVKLLLKAGADPNASGSVAHVGYWTPLLMAVRSKSKNSLMVIDTLIAGGASDMELAPWLLVFPSLVMVLTLMCFNFIGDGLRDAIDPKDR